MRTRVAVVYNEPYPSRYDNAGEEKAVLGVLEAVAAVQRALLELGHDVSLVPLVPPFEQTRSKLSALNTDVVFNLFEGFCGQPETEAWMPGYLSELGIPYTGCPESVLRIALDKARMKVMLKSAGIQTPDFQLLNPETTHTFRLGYPCIVKPRCEDASHGINETSMVHNPSELVKQVQLVAESYGGDALVEEFVDGREYNATVLGNSEYTVLPVSEIVYSLPSGMPRILTFAAKWEAESFYFQGTRAVCPAEIEDKERQCIAETAAAAFRLLGGQGYARVDMRMDKEGRLNVIEVNPNPDISPDTGASRQAGAAGMTYAQFIEKILQLALEKEHHGHQDTPHVKKRQTCLEANTAEYARVQAF